MAIAQPMELVSVTVMELLVIGTGLFVHLVLLVFMANLRAKILFLANLIFPLLVTSCFSN